MKRDFLQYSLLQEGSLSAKEIAEKFKIADKLGANVLLFALDKESNEMCFHDCPLGMYRHIDVSKYSNEDKADAIANRILERILPVGGLVTFAENFRSGRLGVKDEEEAKKLYKCLFDMAEKSDNPYALQYIGRCYEYGWLGSLLTYIKLLNIIVWLYMIPEVLKMKLF